jgi:hypothetical protein
MMMTQLSVIFSFIAVSVVLVCAWTDWPILSLFLPILVILAYVWIGWLICSQSLAKISLLADQTYFLGYLCTITSLGGLLWRIAGDQAVLENSNHTIRMGGIALSTIVVSLVCMSCLKSYAHSSEAQVSIDTKDLEAFLGKISKATEGSDFLPTFTTFLTKLKESLDSAQQIFERAADTKASVDGLSVSVKALRENVSDTAPKAAEFALSVKEVEQVLDRFVKMVASKIDPDVKFDRNDTR